jgi:O-antigen/teichoic acid export membrane protein
MLQGNRLLALMTLGIAGFVLATAPLIMTVWLGRTYPHVALIAALLTLTWVVNNLTGVGSTVVAAIGKPRYESEYALIGMALNVVATVIFGSIYGLFGVIGGTVFGVVTSSTYFLWRVHRLLELPLWEYVGAWLWRLACSIALAAGAVYALRVALPGSLLDDRSNGAFVLVGLALLYACAMLVSLRVFRFLQKRDLDSVARVLPARMQSIIRLPAVEFLFGSRP